MESTPDRPEPTRRRMDDLLRWFASRPRRTSGLILVYFGVVTVTHDLVQDLAYALEGAFGRISWGRFVGAFVLAAAGWFTWRIECAVRRSGMRGTVRLAWWGTIALCGVASLTLLATNMEAIHFLQYGLLAVPVHALTRRFGWTVLLVTLLGAADEQWQYLVIHPGWAVRYDMNDVLLNGLGAAAGVAAIAAFGTAVRPARRRVLAVLAPVLFAGALLGGGGLLLRETGHLALYRPEAKPHTIVLLSRLERPVERWQPASEWGRGHYALHPAAGLLLCLGLAAAFTVLDLRVTVPWDQSEPRTS